MPITTCENYAQFEQQVQKALSSCEGDSYVYAYEQYRLAVQLYLADRDESWNQQQLDDSAELIKKARECVFEFEDKVLRGRSNDK